MSNRVSCALLLMFFVRCRRLLLCRPRTVCTPARLLLKSILRIAAAAPTSFRVGPKTTYECSQARVRISAETPRDGFLILLINRS